MRDYDLTKQHMMTQLQQAEHNRLVQEIKSTDAKAKSILSWIKRPQSASVSSEKITGVPTHQLTPSGTL